METNEDNEPVKHLGTFGRPKKWLVKLFSSPGRIDKHDGTIQPRPTMDKLGNTNVVAFRAGKQYVFSDGSFRYPGRRRVHVIQRGREFVLSGRQLRMLRKRVRRIQKADMARQEAATHTA